MSKKKREQLGMNPSTASGRLVKDLLYRFIVEAKRNSCYVCSEEMSRDTFSIEHRVPWLDSDNPAGLYFDLDNITFSHKSCNFSRSRNAQRNKTCCPAGHAYDEINTRMTYSKGYTGRECIACKNSRNKERCTAGTKEDRQSMRRASYAREKERRKKG